MSQLVRLRGKHTAQTAHCAVDCTWHEIALHYTAHETEHCIITLHHHHFRLQPTVHTACLFRVDEWCKRNDSDMQLVDSTLLTLYSTHIVDSTSESSAMSPVHQFSAQNAHCSHCMQFTLRFSTFDSSHYDTQARAHPQWQARCSS